MEAGQTPVNAMLSQPYIAQSLPLLNPLEGKASDAGSWEKSSELATYGPVNPGNKELGENIGH